MIAVRCHRWISALIETGIPAVFETRIPAGIEHSLLGLVELDQKPADATVELMTINSSPRVFGANLFHDLVESVARLSGMWLTISLSVKLQMHVLIRRTLH